MRNPFRRNGKHHSSAPVVEETITVTTTTLDFDLADVNDVDLIDRLMGVTCCCAAAPAQTREYDNPSYSLTSQVASRDTSNATETEPVGGSMPAQAKYKVLEQIVSALEDGGVDAATVADVKSAYQEANPSAFSNESGLSDEKFAAKAIEFTRKHLRRFPSTDCALAWSLKDLATGESTSYRP